MVFATFAVSRIGPPEGDQSSDVNPWAESSFVRGRHCACSLKAQIANCFEFKTVVSDPEIALSLVKLLPRALRL